MIFDFLALGAGDEIVNSARLRAYLESVGSPLIVNAGCLCPGFSNETVGDEPYTTPSDPASPAPWYDADVPASADFVGVLLLDAEGLDDFPMTRTVTESAVGAAAFGPARERPLTVTLSMLVIGATCCGAAYGLRWLGQALQGCTGTGCGGDCATLYDCCPAAADFEDVAAFNAAHRRTLRRVALTEGPTVISRSGDDCGGSGCKGSGGEVIQVEAVLTAATPWKWRDAVPLLAVDLPRDDGGCIEWCIHGGPNARVCVESQETCASGVAAELIDGACPPGAVAWPDRESLDLECDKSCRLRPCTTTTAGCSDPRCVTETPPTVDASQNCFCEPLAVNSAYYELDLSTQPRWFGSAPILELFAGESVLRNVTIKFYERTSLHLGLTCEEVAEVERCNPFAVYTVTYVPAEATVTIDGQVGRAFSDCGGECTPSADTHGADGGPLVTPLMECDKYCVEVLTDALNVPAADAQLSVSISGREY